MSRLAFVHRRWVRFEQDEQLRESKRLKSILRIASLFSRLLYSTFVVGESQRCSLNSRSREMKRLYEGEG